MTAFDAYYETTGYPHMTRHIALEAWNAALEAVCREECERCRRGESYDVEGHRSMYQCRGAIARSLMANPEER